jgi:glycosyltransferase involved in cell wall biosynthesis
MALSISVVILTFNSEASIAQTLDGAFAISDDVHVVDSFSQDGTEAIVRSTPVHFVQHEFVNYGAQRNWAIDTLPLRCDWELHLDADERPSTQLISGLKTLSAADAEGVDGFLLPRLSVFMGRPLRHGGMYPVWHCRLFRRGKGRCEDRLYDQHFYVDGPTRKLDAPFIDDVRMSLSDWSARHVRWSAAEVAELEAEAGAGRIKGDWSGNAIEQKRKIKGAYYRLPLFARAFLFFLYRYFVRAGFLDGKEGFIFYVLQTFWFRFLVDAQIYERRIAARSAAL